MLEVKTGEAHVLPTLATRFRTGIGLLVARRLSAATGWPLTRGTAGRGERSWLTSTTGVSSCAQPGEDSPPEPKPRRRTQTRTQLRCLHARQSIAASGEAGRAASRSPARTRVARLLRLRGEFGRGVVERGQVLQPAAVRAAAGAQLGQARRERGNECRIGGLDHAVELMRITGEVVQLALAGAVLDVGPVGRAQRSPGRCAACLRART